MTVVFIHGVPETSAIWGPMVDALHRRRVTDVVLLSPPGFGAPLPEGWDPTMEHYTAWLANELDRLDGPADVVGHDWGAGHLYGVLAARPELVRTWAADVAAIIHPDYEWHDLARNWQTPDVGEAVIGAMTGVDHDTRRENFVGLGLPEAMAGALADGLTADMGRCILGLYRSAADPGVSEVGARLFARPSLPPGFVIDPLDDPYAPSALSIDTAARLRVDRLPLESAGHWWMVDPALVDRVAEYLVALWKSA